MKILFICKGNMFRSPIAERIAARMIGKENVESAGTYTGARDEPEGQKISDIDRHSAFIQYMLDQGYDGFGDHRTKRMTEEMVDAADVVVDMSEPEFDLDFVRDSVKTVRWEVENPLFQNYSFEDGYEKTKEIYGILKENVERLINR